MKIYANKNLIYFLYYQYYFNFLKILQENSNENAVGKVIYIAEPKTGNILGSYGNIGPNGEPLQEVFADFSLDKQKVGPNYPPSSPGYYIVQSNQSLQAISMQVYGTSTMAEVLARANGLEQNTTLIPGFRLKIPNLIAEDRNWQGDFQAYDPSQIIGGYMPYIPMPPLKPPHESFWQVVVDCAIFAVGAAIVAMTGGSSAPLVVFLEGLAIGAGTGIAEQEVNHIIFHQQFSWKAVLINAIVTGVSAGIGAEMRPGGLLAIGNKFDQSIEESVEDDVTTRLVEDGLNLKHGFNWQEIVTAAFNGVVGYEDQGLTKGYSHLTEEYINDGIEDTSDMILDDLMEGQHINNVSVEMLTAQLLGTAIGQGIGSQIKFKAPLTSQQPYQKQNVTRGNNHFPGAGHTVPQPQRNVEQLKNDQVKRYTQYHSQAKTEVKQQQQSQVAQQSSKQNSSYANLFKSLQQHVVTLGHIENETGLHSNNQSMIELTHGSKIENFTPSKWNDLKNLYHRDIPPIAKLQILAHAAFVRGLQNVTGINFDDLAKNIDQIHDLQWDELWRGLEAGRLNAINHESIEPKNPLARIGEQAYAGLLGVVGFFGHTEDVGEREWTITSRLKAAKLPTSGAKIRFVPPKSYKPTNPLRKGDKGGFLDKFGNEWTKGPSRTKGQPFEWDVQLSDIGRNQLGQFSRDQRHINVSLDGRITHM